jgi:hypothetical protein
MGLVERLGSCSEITPIHGGVDWLDAVVPPKYLGNMTAVARTLSRLSRTADRFGHYPSLVVVWSVIGTAAIAQRALDRALTGGTNDLRNVAIDLWLILLWAFATPTILRSAARYPVRGDRALRHGVTHLAFALAFVLGTNVIIRLPMLVDRTHTVADFGRDLSWGLVHFGPTALMLFGIIVAIGHLRPRASGDAEPAEALVPKSSSVASLAPLDAVPPSSPMPVPTARRYPERIAVREWSRPRLVRACDVEWIEADDNYVIVQVAGRTYKGRGRISELADQLDPASFVRIHRSAIVRLASIREVQPLAKGDLAVVLHDGKTMRVARSRRGAFEAAFGHSFAR